MVESWVLFDNAGSLKYLETTRSSHDAETVEWCVCSTAVHSTRTRDHFHCDIIRNADCLFADLCRKIINLISSIFLVILAFGVIEISHLHVYFSLLSCQSSCCGCGYNWIAVLLICAHVVNYRLVKLT